MKTTKLTTNQIRFLREAVASHTGRVHTTIVGGHGPYGATGYLYYDDPVREGGIVSYAAATSYADAFAKPATPNRHFIGKVTMPANAGASNTTGTPAKPPGYV